MGGPPTPAASAGPETAGGFFFGEPLKRWAFGERL